MTNRKKPNHTKQNSNSPEPSEIEIIAKEANLTPAQVERVISIEQRWSGPLPPPSVFKQYPVYVQKAMVAQASSQMKHRHKIEDKVVTSNTKNASKGMSFAFIITGVMVIAGTFLVAIGRSTEGLLAIFLPTGFQAGNFLLQKIRGFNRLKKDMEEENEKAIDSKTADK